MPLAGGAGLGHGAWLLLGGAGPGGVAPCPASSARLLLGAASDGLAGLALAQADRR